MSNNSLTQCFEWFHKPGYRSMAQLVASPKKSFVQRQAWQVIRSYGHVYGLCTKVKIFTENYGHFDFCQVFHCFILSMVFTPKYSFKIWNRFFCVFQISIFIFIWQLFSILFSHSSPFCFLLIWRLFVNFVCKIFVNRYTFSDSVLNHNNPTEIQSPIFEVWIGKFFLLLFFCGNFIKWKKT